jgi:hypothetical protein
VIVVLRHQNTLSDYLKQFGISPTEYLWVGFSEFIAGIFLLDGIEYDTDNMNDVSTLFRKMKTIIDILFDFVDYFNIKNIIFESADNDVKSGLIVDYNKRDRFYELFMAHHNINFIKISHKYDIGDLVISDFYVLTL